MLEVLLKLMKNHDYYYQKSDNQIEYDRGKKEREYMQQLYRKLDQFDQCYFRESWKIKFKSNFNE